MIETFDLKDDLVALSVLRFVLAFRRVPNQAIHIELFAIYADSQH